MPPAANQNIAAVEGTSVDVILCLCFCAARHGITKYHIQFTSTQLHMLQRSYRLSSFNIFVPS